MPSSVAALLPRRAWHALIVAAAALSLYAAAGFLAAPPLLRSVIEKRAPALLGRTLTIGGLRLNPFTLSATVENLDLRDPDGAPLLRWDRLFADLQAVSIIRREWCFREIALEGASARVALLPDGRLNVSDIADRLAPPPDPAAAPPPSAPPAVRVDRLRVDGATLHFLDRTVDPTFTSTLGPLRFDVRDFTTHEDARAPFTFAGRSESGEAFSWEGGFSLAPLRSEGSFSFEGVDLTKYHPYYRGTVPFEIRDGRGDVRAAYRFEWSPGTHVLRIESGDATARNLKFAEPGHQEIALETPLTEVKGATIDLLGGEARFRSIVARGGHVLLRQYPDGSINLVNMVQAFYQEPATAPPGGAAPAPAPPAGPAAAPAPPAAAPAPLVRLEEAALVDFTVEAEDQALPRPVRVVLDQVALSLRGVDNVPATTSRGSLDVRWNGEGTLHAEGDLSLMTFVADLRLRAERIDLAPLSPYLDPFLDLRLASGFLSGSGRVRADLQDLARPQFSWSGDLQIDRVATVDGPRGEPFLGWRGFALRGMEYDLRADRMQVREALLVRPEARLAFDPDGRSNLAAVLRQTPPPEEPEEEAAGGTLAPAAPANPPAGAATGLISIGRFTVRDGVARLVDTGVTPTLAVALTGIEGSISGLSSRPGRRARVGITAKFENAAPVSLQGEADPLGADLFTDLALAARGVDLSPFSPWAGRWIGYTLERGKLDVDMKYHLEERRVQGTNLLVADQLTLGDRTDSPDATRMPVRLGLALLRDRNGVIRLDVPVEGSLDDPRFRLGRVIVRAIANLFGKLVTAPFAMLARAFAGRDDIDLGVVEFEPGAATLGAEAVTRVETMANALYERPGLRLSIAGASDPVIDAPALARARVETLVREAKWRSLGRGERETIAPESVVVAPDERPKHLRAAWRAMREALPDDGAAKPATPEAMEAWMLERITIAPEDLRALAAARAAAVRDGLAAGGRVAPERLFLADDGSAAGTRVVLTVQ